MTTPMLWPLTLERKVESRSSRSASVTCCTKGRATKSFKWALVSRPAIDAEIDAAR
jgi:hypothetical protein